MSPPCQFYNNGFMHINLNYIIITLKSHHISNPPRSLTSSDQLWDLSVTLMYILFFLFLHAISPFKDPGSVLYLIQILGVQHSIQCIMYVLLLYIPSIIAVPSTTTAGSTLTYSSSNIKR